MLSVIIFIQCDFPQEYFFIYFVSLCNTTSLIERRNCFRNIVSTAHWSVRTYSKWRFKKKYISCYIAKFSWEICICWPLLCLIWAINFRSNTWLNDNCPENKYLLQQFPEIFISLICLALWRKSFERIFSYLSLTCRTQYFSFIFSGLYSKKDVYTVKRN